MKNKLVVVGIGEIAEMAHDYFSYDSDYEVVAFAAEKDYLTKKNVKEVDGLPVLSIEDMPKKYPADKYLAFVAISYSKLNHDRNRVYTKVKSLGYTMASYVSSKAFIGRNVEIGDNCFILENNVLQRNVKIGDNVTLWSGNHIGHRSVIADNVFLSSQVVLAGFCHIGKFCFLGVNSCVGDTVTIADNCFIGGGVVIMHDTKPNEIYRNQLILPDRLSAELVFGFRGEKNEMGK